MPNVIICISADREVVAPSPRIAVLSISNINERHEGEYTCVATSSAATVEEQFAIRVERGDGGIGNDSKQNYYY